MIRIVKKIQNAIKNRTTYRAGLLQAKVYRALKVFTGEKLATYKISTIDWALLGLLYDNKEGMRSSELSEELGVEPPFITVLFGKLKKMNLVDSKVDANDSRAKNIFLTENGRAFVPKVEQEVFAHTKILIEGISKSELLTYISVLEQMNDNSKNITINNSRHSYYEGV